MDRIEFLCKLEDAVKENTIINFFYKADDCGEVCHCVLGHAYKIVGKGNLLDAMDRDSLARSYRYVQEEELLLGAYTGLKESELQKLQSINDAYHEQEEVKAELLKYIEELKLINV